MTVERRLGCELIGLSTDGKPDYPGMAEHRFYETDTGNISYHTGAAWGIVRGPAAPATLSNKTISAIDNDYELSIAADFPLTYQYRRTGSFIPAVNGPYLCGALGGMGVTVGASENAFSLIDSAEGHCQNFRGNLTGEKMGIQSTTTTNSLITTRGQSPYVAVRCKVDATAGVRLWIGYTSLQTLPASNTILGTTDSGVFIGFGSATTNFTVYNNDGAGGAAMTSNFGAGVAKDNNWHTFEITMTVTTVTCALDGVQVLLSSQLPATTTPLYFNCLVQYV